MSQRDLPLVSVIVITRDRRAELMRCLRSLQVDSYPNKEILVVDNASSEDLGASLCTTFPSLKYFRAEKNLGVAGGRNWGGRQAKGTLLVFIDDDAEMDGEFGFRLQKRFSDDSTLGLLCFRVFNVAAEAEERRCIPLRSKSLLSEDYECAYFAGCAFSVRRDLFLSLGGFWESFHYSCEELDFSYRLLGAGFSIQRSHTLTVKHWATETEERLKRQLYYDVRNRPWLATRNLPWKYVFSTTVLWWGYLLMLSLTKGLVTTWCNAVKDSCSGFFQALSTRQPIAASTMRRVKLLGGRSWY